MEDAEIIFFTLGLIGIPPKKRTRDFMLLKRFERIEYAKP